MTKEKLDYKKLYLKQKKDNILLAGENQKLYKNISNFSDIIIDNAKEIGKYKSEIESLNNIMNIKMGNYHGALAVVEILAKNLKNNG